MKLVIFILFVLIPNFQDGRIINGKGYSGYIFSENHFVLKSITDQKDRFSPTDEHILLAESIVESRIKETNTLNNQKNGCPIIHKNLNKYVRQYVGFINDNGDKIIWINFLWQKGMLQEELKKDIISISDGCSYYWNIEVNIDSHNLTNMQVNGRG